MGSAVVILATTLALAGLPQQISGTRVVTITLTEWKIDMPSSLPAGAYTFKIMNAGRRSHNVEIEADGFKRELPNKLKAGESAELKIDLKPGHYKVTCPIGFWPISHEQQGMVLQLTVM